MVSFPGFSILEELYEGVSSVIYRARRDHDGLPVVLKVLKKEYPLPEEASRFRWEYHTIRELDMDGVIRTHGLETHGKLQAIVLEDFGGESLSGLMPGTPADLDLFFHFACRLADILEYIHSRNVIHKDINPSNIIWNPKSREIKVVDFGISTILPRESYLNTHLNRLEGTLPYISPEQTGRINRGLDFRTDLYSLGATFYEILTGRPPFTVTDPMELVHSHIAKTPVLPEELNPKIPGMVSLIVMKLLAKTAEQRYQSVHGLKKDLEACQEQWQRTGKIEPFPTARQDTFHQLRLPGKLYGRDRELADLMACFEKAAGGGSHMLLVAGYSGIGKSALVNEIRIPVTRKRGFFISGKFEQYQRTMPFSAIISALRDLVLQCLAQNDREVRAWKQKILDRVGRNGQIIVDAIPELELIVGEQPPVPELGPAESRNRFNMVFQNFISVFAQKEHPLVLFLDDLQWVDTASLGLINALITDPDSRFFMLIGAYRDNEVDLGHPLMMTLDDIEKVRSIHRLTLTPLTLPHMIQLVCDTVHREPDACRPLAELILSKTGGNPFFINTFLKTLFRENLLSINRNGEWEWKMVQIREQRITDNVVELLAGQILELGPDTREVLALAACIGNESALDILTLMSRFGPGKTIQALWEAVEMGLLSASSDFDMLNKLAATDGERLGELDLGRIKFRHDRIHQAAYNLISEGERQRLHLEIGWLLLEHTPPGELDNNLFRITGQLNKGCGLIETPKQRLCLAGLNADAGTRAKRATAYGPAADYFSMVPELLGRNRWQAHYRLMFDTRLALAEVLYLAGRFEAADKIYPDLLDRAASKKERVRVYAVQMVQYHLQGRLQDALDAQLSGLSLLGLEIPEGGDEGLQGFLGTELERVPVLLGGRTFQDLVNAPEMSDEDAGAMMQILSAMWITVYVFGDRPNLMAWVCAKMTTLSLEYGNSELAAMAYVNYGLLVSAFMGEFEKGYQAGRMALDLCERYDNRVIRCQVYCIFHNLVNHWKRPISRDLAQYRKAYDYGMQSGEFCYASYALIFLILHQFVTGSRNLVDLHDETMKFDRIIRKISPASLVYSDPLVGHIKNLLGLTPDVSELNWGLFDEETHTRDHGDNPLVMCWWYCAKLEILYLYERHDQALALWEQAETIAATRPGQVVIPQIYFYTALNLLKCYPKADAPHQEQYMAGVDRFLEKLKTWSAQCEANHTHKYLLVEAEKAAVSGRHSRAADLYDQAVESAAAHGFINNAALANEAAAKFWLGRGKTKFAGLYMREAWYLFQQWGAKAKANDLEKKYPELLAGALKQTTAGLGDGLMSTQTVTTTATTVGTTVETALSLDFHSAMKASQAISQEIVLHNLLEKMVNIIVENAGAQKGRIILDMDGSLRIFASCDVEPERLEVSQALALDTSDEVPVSLVQYVARTRESLVMGEEQIRDRFPNDPYVSTREPKSILCTPILNKGTLTGVLYLENDLAANAFTPDRLALLKVLSAQMAISIENARLYRDLDTYNRSLENRVAQRTEDLNQALEKIEVSNRKITDSIKYAKRIQKAMLPEKSEVRAQLPEHFILWKPRDIVGGDIFSLEQVDNGLLICVMDCTGHGVPGALMSMIASSLLKRQVRSASPQDPAGLLMQLNREVKNSLGRDREAHRISDDGLDAAICYLNMQTHTLTFAGARLPLLYIAGNDIIRIKGDRQSLGYKSSDPDFTYTNHQVPIQSGMRFYLFTDGFSDQLGGPKGIRYGINRFMKTLNELRNTPLPDQGGILFKKFETYRGKRMRQDDLTVIGFSVF